VVAGPAREQIPSIAVQNRADARQMAVGEQVDGRPHGVREGDQRQAAPPERPAGGHPALDAVGEDEGAQEEKDLPGGVQDGEDGAGGLIAGRQEY
jgi:hypothetical protein